MATGYGGYNSSPTAENTFAVACTSGAGTNGATVNGTGGHGAVYNPIRPPTTTSTTLTSRGDHDQHAPNPKPTDLGSACRDRSRCRARIHLHGSQLTSELKHRSALDHADRRLGVWRPMIPILQHLNKENPNLDLRVCARRAQAERMQAGRLCGFQGQRRHLSRSNDPPPTRPGSQVGFHAGLRYWPARKGSSPEFRVIGSAWFRTISRPSRRLVNARPFACGRFMQRVPSSRRRDRPA